MLPKERDMNALRYVAPMSLIQRQRPAAQAHR